MLLFECRVLNLGINLGAGQITMPQHLLNIANIHAILQHMGCYAVAYQLATTPVLSLLSAVYTDKPRRIPLWLAVVHTEGIAVPILPFFQMLSTLGKDWATLGNEMPSAGLTTINP